VAAALRGPGGAIRADRALTETCRADESRSNDVTGLSDLGGENGLTWTRPKGGGDQRSDHRFHAGTGEIETLADLNISEVQFEAAER
jgi:hypothetical protein